jgi:hypothetical protein
VAAQLKTSLLTLPTPSKPGPTWGAEHGTDLRDEGGLAAKDLTAVVDQAGGGARASLSWNA